MMATVWKAFLRDLGWVGEFNNAKRGRRRGRSPFSSLSLLLVLAAVQLSFPFLSFPRSAYRSSTNLAGSSTYSLMFFKNVTALLPSMMRWSYVSATYIMGLISTLSPTTTARLKMPCIPRMALWGGVDDGRSKHAAEDSPVGDGERAPHHILDGDLALARFRSVRTDGRFDLSEVHRFGVAQHRHDQASPRAHGHGHIDEIMVHDGAVLDVCVHLGILEQSGRGGLDEGAHETELHTVLLEEFVLVAVADLARGGREEGAGGEKKMNKKNKIK